MLNFILCKIDHWYVDENMPNLIFNAIIAFIFTVLGIVLFDYLEKPIQPKSIWIEQAIAMQNTKTQSVQSSNSLIIYTKNGNYRSSCLGLEQFCSMGQATYLNQSIKIEFLQTSKKRIPEGIILRIINMDLNQIQFKNDEKHIHQYLIGNRNVKWMFSIIGYVSLCYLLIFMIKIWRFH